MIFTQDEADVKGLDINEILSHVVFDVNIGTCTYIVHSFSTGSSVKEDEALLSQRIKEELGDDYSENPLVIRDRVSRLILFTREMQRFLKCRQVFQFLFGIAHLFLDPEYAFGTSICK